MIINDSPIKAEVEAEFAAYERALVANDVAALDRFFLDSEHAIRFGAGENLYGMAAIRAFRAGRPSAGLARTLESTSIVTYGHDLAVAATLFAARLRPARSAARCRPGCASPRAGASSPPM